MPDKDPSRKQGRRPVIIPGVGFGWSEGDGDPFGDEVPPEHWPTSFLTDDEFEAKYQAWLATHEADRDDTPDPFDW